MGQTVSSIPFTDNKLTIVPHSATHSNFLDRPVSLEEFSGESRVRVDYIHETCEYMFTLPDYSFIVGPLKEL